MTVAYLGVITFDGDSEGDLKLGEAHEVLSPTRGGMPGSRARARTRRRCGVFTYRRSDDSEFQGAVILAQFGEVDLDRSASERRRHPDGAL
jgi:hypothetical protein